MRHFTSLGCCVFPNSSTHPLFMSFLLRIRLILVCLIITPLFCYLEWGGGQSSFLYEIEWKLITLKTGDGGTLTHPLVFLPMAGQLLLIINLFRQKPSRKLGIAGILLIAPLVLMILLSGAFSVNARILLSVIPFLAASIWFWRASTHIT